MALPQSIDPTSLNLSGKPAIATAPTTATSAVDLGMPNPTIGMEKNTVSPLLGSLFGGLLGYGYSQKNAGATANKPTANTPSGNAPLGNAPSGNLPTGSTPTGNIGSVQNVKVPSSIPISEAQSWLNANYGFSNGQPNYVVSGTNLYTGEVIGLPNDKIGGTNLGTNTGNFGFEADTGTTTGGGATTAPTDTTPTETPQYFQDSQGNIYDATGTLIRAISGDTASGGTSPQYFQDADGNVYDENLEVIYRNPSNAILGTNDGGGGYDPNVSDTEQYYEDSLGNIFDYTGELVLEFGNGYYYEPDTGNFYDSNFDSVGDDFSAYQDFFNIPTYPGSGSGYDDYDFSDLFDYGNYTSGSTTYIKDGGSVRGGLATPLFRNGGSVPRFADGGTSFIDQVVANQMPQSVTSTGTTATTPVAMETQENLTNPPQSILDSILGFAKNNPTITGAGLGAILTTLINSQTEQPVNRGVDMSALGTLKPRTTPTGAARFVPYSEYGTPTTPYDYSQLYENLGVSPFGAGAGVLSPSAVPTSSVSAQPTTAPIGGLSTAPSTMSSTGTVTTPPASSSPQYFQDADGNIYNANGDLVYDTTTSSTTPTAQASVASSPLMATLQTAPAPMTSLAVTTPEAQSSYYSYGTNVTPSQILSSKNGGEISKFAYGGLSRAQGGSPHGNANIPMTEGNNPNVPIVQGRQDYREGAYVQGAGDGQSDDIPAMLADGEYVIDAETVAQLGNGSNKAGAKMLDKFRENIRSHKRNTPTHKIPPKSKSPLAYLKGAK